MSKETITRYAAFWPYYLREHSKPLTRSIHIAGTLAALAVLVFALLAALPGLLPAVPLAGYGPAWGAHFLVEKNLPATFRYPLWSLLSDLRMALLWTAGGLESELQRVGIGPFASPES